MTLKSWISAIRQRSAAFTAAAAMATVAMSGNMSVADEPLVTRIGRFQIPFDVDAEPGQRVDGFAVLYGSQDGGANWEQLQSVPAGQGAFTFTAPRDGRYSFAIRIADSQGTLPPSSAMQGAPPELDVIVDTAAPDLKLELFESNPGQVIVSWTCTDISANPNSLAMEYADAADGRWKQVPLQPAVNGQAIITASKGSVISVRAMISDAAGNRGEAASQIVCKNTTNPGPVGNPTAVANRPATPLGPSPFSNGFETPGTNPATNPAMMQGNVAPATPSGMNSARMVPAVSPQLPPGIPNTAPLPTVAGYPAGGGFPMLPMAGTSDVQIVNTSLFDVDYQVDDVGPSGVSAVELFVTEDGGQQWFRYGSDPDLRSPFSVDTRGEGTFGFAVRIRNGLGFADTPPQPGQAPEIVVTVDHSAPVIEFAQPVVKADGFATIQLAWRISDQHPSATPVRLEHSPGPNGPWSVVFDWQVDQGGFQWAVRPGTPASLYFRLLARDSAGNVASSATPQPVMVDTKRPVGRLLRVQTVSQPATPSY